MMRLRSGFFLIFECNLYSIKMRDPQKEIIKKRLLFGIIGSLLFVYLGWYLFSTSEKQRMLPGDVVEIIGIVAMVFFGIAALIGIKKFLSQNP